MAPTGLLIRGVLICAFVVTTKGSVIKRQTENGTDEFDSQARRLGNFLNMYTNGGFGRVFLDDPYNTENARISSNSDVDASTPELASKYGYDTETHEVETKDGYILTHFRIKEKNERKSNSKKPVVLLLHCSFINSDSWILLGKKSLGFSLVDAGFDVWLLNARGTNYSNRHRSLSSSEPAYWNTSWHETGVYDLPASIDYVLSLTDSKKLSYIGYSAGSTAFFVMLSEKPEYNDKIATMLAYAPLAYVNHIRNAPMIAFSRVADSLLNFAKMSRATELLSLSGPVRLMKEICRVPTMFYQICLPMLNAQYGWNNDQEDPSLAPVFVSHITITPLQLMVHYAQNIQNKKFQQYRYPTVSMNVEKYGQAEPPEYNLQNTRIPVAVFYSKDDPFADETDIQDLIKALPNVALSLKIQKKNFDHVSFLWGKDAPKLLYQPTISYLLNATGNVNNEL